MIVDSTWRDRGWATKWDDRNAATRAPPLAVDHNRVWLGLPSVPPLAGLVGEEPAQCVDSVVIGMPLMMLL